jgi:acyl-CoA synthetase (NDP forming)
MLASAPPEHYRRTVAAVLRDDRVDSAIVIFIPPLVTDPDAVAGAIVEGARGIDGKPVLGVFMRASGAPASLAPIPTYAFPESAALALARVTAYGHWRETPPGTPPVLDRFDRAAARRVIDGVLGHGGGWLPQDDALALLAAAGIEAAQSRVVGNADEAAAAASMLGFPVVLKAIGPTLLHKTERGAVRLDLRDEAGLRAAAADFTTRFGAELTGLLVQQMVPPGVEMIVGVVLDPLFGPLIACGSGGVLVDVLADTTFRLHPLSTADAQEMIGGLRGVRLLRGFRNAPPADEAAFRSVLLRVSELVTVCPEIQELDLNPVIVLTEGARVADVRIRVERAAQRPQSRRVEY